jgi:hypothetical protein
MGVRLLPRQYVRTLTGVEPDARTSGSHDRDLHLVWKTGAVSKVSG